MSICSSDDRDEAMEWITDWEYERIHHPAEQEGFMGVPPSQPSEDDASMDMMEDDEEEDDMHPIPIESTLMEEAGHGSASSRNEVSIFWTRVHEDLTEEELNGMFGLNANMTAGNFSGASSRRTSGTVSLMLDEGVAAGGAGGLAHALPTTSAAAGSHPHSLHHSHGDMVYSADGSDAIMSPLQDKEGLLPPMSDSQMYHESNAQYGIIKSPPSHQDPMHHHQHPHQQHPHHQHHHHPHHQHHTEASNPMYTTSASSDYATMTQEDPSSATKTPSDIFERQQQLLQEVLEQAPQRSQKRREHDLPRPDTKHQMIMKEMRSSVHERPPKPVPAKPDREDPIFARQQEIFQQLRVAGQRQKQEPPPPSPRPYHHTSSNGGVSYHHQHPHYNSPTMMTHASPVSVTKSITQAGMDSAEYQKVVTRLTEKNLMERQRIMLQESMKRSLETRQALHIKPTALPDFDHDKLSQVLRDIESSSRNISETYGRR
eukprot:Nitzschia sp. Nitz4//scaffold335_size18684//9423//10880//NITZ4_008770-RA/size18684-processed-gene-0.5-mRNA-1//-1//CDS//3329548276//4932//frame0